MVKTLDRMELEFGRRKIPAVVEFIRDIDNKHWFAKVWTEGTGETVIRQTRTFPFRPCDRHAERLVMLALDRHNSARPA